MKWLFRRLFPAYGGPDCFLQSETVVQTKRRHFIVFKRRRNSNEFLEPLWQPFSDRHFERGEGPGDQVETIEQNAKIDDHDFFFGEHIRWIMTSVMLGGMGFLVPAWTFCHMTLTAQVTLQSLKFKHLKKIPRWNCIVL